MTTNPITGDLLAALNIVRMGRCRVQEIDCHCEICYTKHALANYNPERLEQVRRFLKAHCTANDFEALDPALKAWALGSGSDAGRVTDAQS